MSTMTVSRAGDLFGAERMKLLANRSFWWCTGMSLAWVAGIVALQALYYTDAPVSGDEGVGLVTTLVTVMAVLAITGEYRHGTIRATFLAAPNRTMALLAKTTVVAVVAAALGLVIGLAGHGLAAALRPENSFSLAALDWRSSIMFALYAVLAVAVGILVRHTAGAIVLMIVWPVVDMVLAALPGLGERLNPWLLFSNVNQFWSADRPQPGEPMFAPEMAFGPWGSLAYASALTAVVLGFALFMANRRDA